MGIVRRRLSAGLGPEEEDAMSAQRLQISWTATYSTAPVRGDSQFSAITISGAKRGVNVGPGILPTRGLLSFEITTSGGVHTVSWYAGVQLVAVGTITGNGPLTCAEESDSGLSVDCTLTYTGDVAEDVAFIELRWPASYQIHYSTSALVFPRTPEASYLDRGYDDYTYLTPILSPGTYYWNVLEVDDDGDVQSGSYPTTTAQVIYAPPAAPTITSVTGNSAALVVHWSIARQRHRISPSFLLRR
jgi:hypothetical protein